MTIKLTDENRYDLAHGAARDAANRLMIAKGLDHWDEECYNRACEVMNQILGPPPSFDKKSQLVPAR